MPRKDDLAARLVSYQSSLVHPGSEPADEQELQHLERMLSLCRSDAELFSRAHFVPGHITASAFVLSPDWSALLLVLHGKLKRWLQPGGHVETEDAHVLAAAQREVREEVGLSEPLLEQPGIFDLDVHEIPAIKADPAHLHFDVRFLFRAPSLAFQAGSDAKAARWVPLTELSEELSDRSVMRAVEELLARSEHALGRASEDPGAR